MSVSSKERGVALFFSGQGSQHKGMGRDYYESSSAAQKIFDRADALALKFNLGYSITRLCFEDPNDELRGKNLNTAKIQPALFTVDIAIYEHLKSMGLKRPNYGSGHSAGKLAAYVAADALDFDRGFETMIHRGESMGKSSGNREGVVGILDTWGKEIPGFDVSLGLVENVKETFDRLGPLASSFRVSVDNTPYQVMFSGLKQQVEPVLAELAKIPNRMLEIYEGAPVSHTPLMIDAQRGFNEFMEGIRNRIEDLHFPIIDDREGLIITSPGELFASLTDHIIEPISWRKAVLRAVEKGATVGLEVGPGKVLRGISTRWTGLEVGTTGTLEEAEKAKQKYPFAFTA